MYYNIHIWHEIKCVTSKIALSISNIWSDFEVAKMWKKKWCDISSAINLDVRIEYYNK